MTLKQFIYMLQHGTQFLGYSGFSFTAFSECIYRGQHGLFFKNCIKTNSYVFFSTAACARVLYDGKSLAFKDIWTLGFHETLQAQWELPPWRCELGMKCQVLRCNSGQMLLCVVSSWQIASTLALLNYQSCLRSIQYCPQMRDPS